VPPVDDLLEITDMLADQSRSWTHQWKMEGVQEGEVAVLLRLLTRKFGVLPEPIEKRVRGATTAQLETWSLNILDAETLEEVFLG